MAPPDTGLEETPTLPLPGRPRPGARAPRVRTLDRLGPWRLLAPAGEGSGGRVYRGRHVLLGREAAVKVLHRALWAEPDEVARFVDEARLSARVAHPHVVSAEHVEPGGRDAPSWSVFRWVEGETLAGRLRRGVLGLAEALAAAAPLASALAAVHAVGLLHGDLKPENVLLAGGAAHLLDFGAARERGRPRLPLRGTPAYLAPEVVRGEPGDGRADLFALGCVLQLAITGRPAFPPGEPARVLQQRAAAHPASPLPGRTAAGEPIPPVLRALVLRLLEPLASRRPASAAEVAEVLGQLSVASR
jgi:serine/threonine protein kinase